MRVSHFFVMCVLFIARLQRAASPSELFGGASAVKTRVVATERLVTRHKLIRGVCDAFCVEFRRSSLVVGQCLVDINHVEFP